MARVVTLAPKKVPPGALVERYPVDSPRVATFRPGEDVPDADFIRLTVPAGTEPALAEEAERLARMRTPNVKLNREPEHRAASRAEPGEVGEFDRRNLRQVVEDRARRAERVRDLPALLQCLDELLTDSGL